LDRGSAPGLRRPDLCERSIENGDQIRAGEGALQSAEQRADADKVERASPLAQDPMNVIDVLRAPRQDLRYQEILDADHRNGHAPEVQRTRALDELILER
jgi:hypothetical protein